MAVVDQVYYSIDKEPEICARFIAQAIKAKPVQQEPSFWTAFHKRPVNEGLSFDELLQKMGDRMSRTWDEIIYRHFMEAMRGGG